MPRQPSFQRFNSMRTDKILQRNQAILAAKAAARRIVFIGIFATIVAVAAILFFTDTAQVKTKSIPAQHGSIK